MTLRLRRFYEKYWTRDVGIPENDLTTNRRKSLLANALKVFLGNGDRSPSRVILDAGCGSGEFTEFLADEGYISVGVDISIVALRRAKWLGRRGPFCVASLEDGLPFQRGRFDAVWATEVLEHIFDVHAVLSEFNALLRERGLVILTTPYHGLIKNLAIALFYFGSHFNPYVSHIRFFTRKTLFECLRQAGFEPVRFAGIGRWWPLRMSMFVVGVKGKSPESGIGITG